MNIQLIAFLQCIGICATLADDTSPANRYLRKKNRKPHGVSANSCKGLDGTSSGIVPWAEGGPTSVSNFEELKTAIANATNPSPQAKIRLCPGTITFTSDVDLTDKYFSIYCEKGGGEDDDECVLDLNGRSFFNDVVMGSDFSLEFEEVNIINGNAGPREGGEDPFEVYAGGAFFLKGNGTATNNPKIIFRNSKLIGNKAELGNGGAVFARNLDIDVIDSTVLDNKVGTANGNPTANKFRNDGGAFYVQNCTMNVIGSNFTSNSAFPQQDSSGFGSLATGQGGAIYTKDSDVSIIDSIMESNTAIKGGALFNFEDLSELKNTKLNIKRTRFVRNRVFRPFYEDRRGNFRKSGGEGGAIKIAYVDSITFESCEFDENYAAFRGGAFDINKRFLLSGALFKKCSFTNNVAATTTEGRKTVYGGGAGFMTDGRTRFIQCNFFNNLGVKGQGGALVGVGADPTNPKTTGNDMSIERSAFTCNQGRLGGAVTNIRIEAPGRVNISDSTFDGNMATGGFRDATGWGSMYLQNVNTTISGSQFIGNVGGGAKARGGAIQLAYPGGFNTSFSMMGTTFRDNIFRNSTTSFPNDMDYSVHQSGTFDPRCGANSRPGNSFCDADASMAPLISTNNPDTFCEGACIGPKCPRCSRLPDINIADCPLPPVPPEVETGRYLSEDLEDMGNIDIGKMSAEELAESLIEHVEGYYKEMEEEANEIAAL